MSEFDDAVAFYDRHYDVIGQWHLRPGTKVLLGDQENRVCRFCGKRPPEVTFKLEAHAIPELLGNKSISSTYECDACNQAFGAGIENDLGNWSKPMRTFARIRGKSGVPTLKKGSSGGWRIEYGPSGFNIKMYEDEPIFEINKAEKKITLRLRRDPYTPIAVLKAFVKMGLTLMPAAEITNFGAALAWVKQPDHQLGRVRFPILYTFQPGPMPNDLIVALLFRRKEDAMKVPYAFFVLGYGNEVFQVMLPSTERDSEINGKGPEIYRLPMPQSLMPKEFGQPLRSNLDLTGTELVKGEVFPLVLGFEEARDNSLASGAAGP